MKEDEKDLTDEGITPGGIEVPKEEGAKEEASEPEACDTCEKAEPVFTASVELDSEFIEGKSFQEIMGELDTKLKTIRDAAIIKFTELRN